MPEYKTTVQFEKQFIIKARAAAEANEKLEEEVHQTEWDGNVENKDFYLNTFEDEPVTCPKCKGTCCEGETDEPCSECDGDGSVPFKPEVKP